MIRRRTFLVGITSSMLGAMLMGPAAANAATAQLAATDAPITATVTAAALNVRNGPGTIYAVITAVQDGAVLTVTGQDAAGGWWQVTLPDGRQGWVSQAYTRLSGQASAVPTVAVPTMAAPATTAASTARATAQSSAAGHMIVFQMASGGVIFIVNPDGTSLHRLTTGIDPAISPDGKQVAFTRWDGTSNGVSGSLWVINIDGTGERQVMCGTAQPKSPTWSADGSKVVISMQQGGTISDTWVCIIDHKPVVVPQPIAGQRCMRQFANPNWGLREVDMATGAYEDLPRETHSFAPTWDPANAWHVVFRGDQGLVSLDLNRKTTWVVKNIGGYLGPVFSPDGAKLAVTYKQSDHWEIHVMNADGTGEVRLTETPLNVLTDLRLAGKAVKSWDNAAPAWSPDGSQIAFITNRMGLYELWVMNADGSNQHVLLPAAALGGAAIEYDGMDERVISWR
jgi:dipeptidyl aminopeptidase/acylaminoacyl peptidase